MFKQGVRINSLVQVSVHYSLIVNIFCCIKSLLKIILHCMNTNSNVYGTKMLPNWKQQVVVSDVIKCVKI